MLDVCIFYANAKVEQQLNFDFRFQHTLEPTNWANESGKKVKQQQQKVWIWVQQLHNLHRNRTSHSSGLSSLIHSTTWPTPAAAQWRQWTHHCRCAGVMTFHFYDDALLFFILLLLAMLARPHTQPSCEWCFWQCWNLCEWQYSNYRTAAATNKKTREENCHHCRDNIRAAQPIHCHSKWEANNTIDELSCLLGWGAGSSVMLTLPPLLPLCVWW